jgi:hypothetical protein
MSKIGKHILISIVGIGFYVFALLTNEGKAFFEKASNHRSEIQTSPYRSNSDSLERAMYGATIQSINQRELIKRRENIANLYSTKLSQEDLNLLKTYIANSQNPELSTLRFNEALAIKREHKELDLTTILRDLEEKNQHIDRLSVR